MRVGREVRISLVLSSWIAVLCCGIGAFGSEMARGTSIGVSRVTRSACRLPVPACRCAFGETSLLGDEWGASSHFSGFYSPVSAMAIPDGPGAVWLSILGFVCVSALKNRRAWIRLCLCVLSCDRMCEARLAKVGVTRPEGVTSKGSDKCRLHVFPRGNSLRLACRPVSPAGIPRSLILGPCRSISFSAALCGNRVLPSLPPQRDVSLAGVRETRPDGPMATAPIKSLSVEWKGLARPPPVSSQTSQDQKDLSSVFPLLAQQRRKG